MSSPGRLAMPHGAQGVAGSDGAAQQAAGQPLRDELRSLLEAIPTSLHAERGEVFSTGLSALKPGDFYLAGLNPGGGGSYPTIGDHVSGWNLADYSAFTDQCWRPECWEQDCVGRQSKLNCACVRGDTRHQRAVRRMITRCGGVALKQVFATNAVFVKSASAATFRSETGFTLRKAFDACWPAHARLLSIVRPKVVLCLGYQAGGSPFSLFMTKAAKLSEIRTYRRPDRHYDSFKAVTVAFQDSRIPGQPLLVGIRHPSWVEDAADCAQFEEMVRARLAER